MYFPVWGVLWLELKDPLALSVCYLVDSYYYYFYFPFALTTVPYLLTPARIDVQLHEAPAELQSVSTALCLLSPLVQLGLLSILI